MKGNLKPNFVDYITILTQSSYRIQITIRAQVGLSYDSYYSVVITIIYITMAANRRYKLSYFPFLARAEPIRIILSLAGVDWENNRNVTYEDLAALKEGL